MGQVRGQYGKGRQQRQALLAAAFAVFADAGPAISLAAVAERAGLSRDSVRHYFPSIRDLLLSMQESVDRGYFGHLSSIDLAGRLRIAVETAQGSAASTALTALLTAQAIVDTDGPIHIAMSARLRRLRSELCAAVTQAQTEGQFRSDIDASVIAEMLLALSDGLASHRHLDNNAGAAASQEMLLRMFEEPQRENR